MELLPPVEWADVATKRDLDVLRTELQLEMARGFNRQTRWILTYVTGLNGLLFAGMYALAA